MMATCLHVLLAYSLLYLLASFLLYWFLDCLNTFLLACTCDTNLNSSQSLICQQNPPCRIIAACDCVLNVQTWKLLLELSPLVHRVFWARGLLEAVDHGLHELVVFFLRKTEQSCISKSGKKDLFSKQVSFSTLSTEVLAPSQWGATPDKPPSWGY